MLQVSFSFFFFPLRIEVKYSDQLKINSDFSEVKRNSESKEGKLSKQYKHLCAKNTHTSAQLGEKLWGRERRKGGELGACPDL